MAFILSRVPGSSSFETSGVEVRDKERRKRRLERDLRRPHDHRHSSHVPGIRNVAELDVDTILAPPLRSIKTGKALRVACFVFVMSENKAKSDASSAKMRR